MTRLIVIDPRSLRGRELLALLPRFPGLQMRVEGLHTAHDEEHEIAEVDGEPVLIPPLEDPAQLDGADAVVLASDSDGPRLEVVERYLDLEPAAPFLDLRGAPSLRERLAPIAGTVARRPDPPWARLAHPAVVATRMALDPLSHLSPAGITVAATDSVSSLGSDAVEKLARQGAQRLQGQAVEDRIADQILAFTAVTAFAEDLAADLRQLMPGLHSAATRTLGGSFHGQLVHLGVHFPEAVDLDEITDAWRDDPRLVLTPPPVRLDEVADSEQLHLTPPQMSAGGRLAAFTVMLDGLRLGVALTGIDALRSLIWEAGIELTH